MVGHALVSILHIADWPQDKVACWIVREPREEPDFGPSWGAAVRTKHSYKHRRLREGVPRVFPAMSF